MARKPTTRAPKPAATPPAGVAGETSAQGLTGSAAELNGVVEVAPPSAEEKAPGKAPSTSPIARLRFKASRPTYRRGGLLLNDRGWTEVARDDLTVAQHLALLADPFVSIEGSDGDEIWSRPRPEIRAGLIEVFREQLAGLAVEAPADQRVSETGRQ